MFVAGSASAVAAFVVELAGAFTAAGRAVAAGVSVAGAVAGGAVLALLSGSSAAKPVSGPFDPPDAAASLPLALAGAAAGGLAMRLAAAMVATGSCPYLSAIAVARAGPVWRRAIFGFMSIGRILQSDLRQARTAATRQSLPRRAATFSAAAPFSAALAHKSVAQGLRAASAGQKRLRADSER
ncbi:MAG: hypothetical protein KGL26_00755 [Pseudomonadota bacterium]|nr:hypothetical protein [Pseudomonadota bacterium]